jgi:hypothetical protein
MAANVRVLEFSSVSPLGDDEMQILHQALINRHFQAYRLIAKLGKLTFYTADQT